MVRIGESFFCEIARARVLCHIMVAGHSQAERPAAAERARAEQEAGLMRRASPALLLLSQVDHSPALAVWLRPAGAE